MAARLPQVIDHDAPIFTISVAANLAGMHPQTLRTYDRLGLVVPQRTRGRGRRYSPRDVARLRLVQHLSQEEGVNLQGIQRILQMQTELDDARAQIERLQDELATVRVVAASVPGSRIFTASAAGAVHLGRTVRQQLALPGR